jgi:hypothetical protein
MPCVEFEPTIPASERAKTVDALDCGATVTGLYIIYYLFYFVFIYLFKLQMSFYPVAVILQ